MPFRCVLVLLLLCTLPSWAQTATSCNFFRIANGGYTPIPNDPAVSGQNVFFRFRMDDANGVQLPSNSGNVTVYQDGVLLFQTPWVREANGGTNTFNRRAPDHFALGEHNFRAEFTPNNIAVYSASQSGTLYQSWGPAAGPQTATQLSSTANPSDGANYSIVAQVVGLAGNPVAGGSVSFTIDGTPFASNPVAVDLSGRATLTSAQVPGAVGNHTFEATYNPDLAHLGGGSTANPFIQTVSMVSSTTTVTSSVNPSLVGDSVTFTATVSGTPTGTVTFTINGTAQTPSTLPPGGNQATFTTSTLALGNHPVTADYSGDATVAPSSGTLTGGQQVRGVPTNTLTSTANPSVAGQAVTLNATVTGTGPTPTGNVTFTYAGGSLGTVALSGGSATLSVPAANLTVGTHPASFTYTGDTNYGAGSAGTLAGGQVVNQASTTTTVTAAPNPSADGQTVTFTATVTAQAPGSGTPTGTVTFRVDGGPPEPPATLVGGAATLTRSFTSGSHTVEASYSGSTDFLVSTGVVSQTVSAPPPPGSQSTAIYAFSLQLLEGPATVAPGSAGRFRILLSNNGNRNDFYQLTVSGHAGATVSTPELVVGAGGSGEAIVTLAVPAGANPGSVQLFLTAVSANEPSVRSESTLKTRVSGLATFSLSLRAGWNGVGFESGTLASLAANPLVVGLAQLRNGAYETQPFVASSVAATTTGYWVFAQGPTTVTYTGGVVSDGSMALQAGWNLVAFPCEGPARVLANSDVLAQFTEIQADNSYQIVEGTVTPGRAYWVFARQATTLRYER